MPTRHVNGSTSDLQRVYPLTRITRIVSSLFERTDARRQLAFTFSRSVGHTITVGRTGYGKTGSTEFGADFNEVVLAPAGSGMSLHHTQFVQRWRDLATEPIVFRDMSLLDAPRYRSWPFAVAPSHDVESRWLAFDDAWREAAPERPAVSVSALGSMKDAYTLATGTPCGER